MASNHIFIKIWWNINDRLKKFTIVVNTLYPWMMLVTTSEFMTKRI